MQLIFPIWNAHSFQQKCQADVSLILAKNDFIFRYVSLNSRMQYLETLSITNFYSEISAFFNNFILQNFKNATNF